MVLVLSHPNLFPHYDPWRHSAELVMKGTVPRQGSDPPPPTPGFSGAQRCRTPMRRREHLREEPRPRAPGVQSPPPPPPMVGGSLQGPGVWNELSMLFLCQALSSLARTVTGRREAADSRFRSRSHLPGRAGPGRPGRLLFAGPRRQAVEVDLSGLLGQEDVLHPWVVLDFFEGWPIRWSQGQAPSDEMLTL